MRNQSSRLSRRAFAAHTSRIALGVIGAGWARRARSAGLPPVRIEQVLVGEPGEGVTLVANDGTRGGFAGSNSQNLDALAPHLDVLRKLLVGRDPFDPDLEGALLWETIYPGCAQRYSVGRDPLTDAVILNKPRGGRHSETGRVFMAFSTFDNALWDLRARLRGMPAYRIIGDAQRTEVPVYWRPGEADQGLDDARRRARDAYDRGYRHQKWYFTKSAQDGEAGLKENIELVRVLREELPDAHLLFDNHSIRYFDDVDYAVRLCKAIAPYKPFWVEEPICPEHLDGYAKIKEHAGVPIAGGEHWHTRWQVQPFLDRKCVNFVQADPVWCGGISEWLRIRDLVRAQPGVQLVPHITSPWTAAPHCVASQPETLCPLLEFNYEGGRQSLEDRMTPGPDGAMRMRMPEAPGIS